MQISQERRSKKQRSAVSLNRATPYLSAAVFQLPITIDGKPINILIDSGSDFSILPPHVCNLSALDRQTPLPHILSANHHPLVVHGWFHARVTMQNLECPWTFLCADSVAILGSDFFAAKNLLINCRTRQLISVPGEPHTVSATAQQTTETAASNPPPTHPSDPSMTLEDILAQYQDLFDESSSSLTIHPHTVCHQITTSSKIISSRPYRLPLAKIEEVRVMFDDMLSKGIITPSDSPYASPLVLVQKKDGSMRPCVDYRRLNEITIPDQYNLPRIEDLIQSVTGRFFSTLDLRAGYHQIPMDPEDAPKTAVITPFGLFHFLRMPFGLRNAGATFQRFLHQVTRGLPGVVVYVDDILVFGDTLEEHHQRLRALLSRLREYCLKANGRKCHFAKQEVKFLGYALSHEGYAPNPERIEALLSFTTPTTLSEVKRFIGMVNFYRQHILHFAEVMSPLYKLREPFAWTTDANDAFHVIQDRLAKVTLLRTPDPKQVFHVYTDASNIATGATITQKGYPLAFYSSRLSPPERRYSTFDREALAVIKTVRAYKHWFLESTTVIHTDHKPLLGLTHMKDPSPRQSRWISFLTQMNVTWVYEPGCQNTAADYFSRPTADDGDTGGEKTAGAMTLDSIGPPEWHETLKTFNPLQEERNLESLVLKKFNDYWFDVSTGRQRLLIPQPLRRPCFNLVHDLAHFGKEKTFHAISQRFVWPSMRKDIHLWCQECHQCQVNKPNSQPPRVPQPFVVHERFHTLHVDIVGPLPQSQRGRQYLVTMIDHFTRWIEAIPVKNISAENCANVLLEHWICRHGIPVNIVSDQGTQFESQLFNALLLRLGIQRHRTTAYHPQSNGAVERAHRTLKQCLRTFSDRETCWERALPFALLAMRTSLHASTKFPPSQLVFGSDIRLPADFISPRPPASQDTADFAQRLSSEVFRLLPIADRNQPTRHTPDVSPVSSWVWLKEPPGMQGALHPQYRGPYEVIDQSGPVISLKVHGKITKVNIDRVKPATFGEKDDQSPSCTSKETPTPPLATSPTSSMTSAPCEAPSAPGTLPSPCPPAPDRSRFGRPITYRFHGPKYVFHRRRQPTSQSITPSNGPKKSPSSD